MLDCQSFTSQVQHIFIRSPSASQLSSLQVPQPAILLAISPAAFQLINLTAAQPLSKEASKSLSLPVLQPPQSSSLTVPQPLSLQVPPRYSIVECRRVSNFSDCQSLFSSQKKTLLHHADFLWLPKVTKVGFKRA